MASRLAAFSHAAFLAFALALPSAGGASTKTVTTTYTYNDDGALTAMTVDQQAGGSTTTIFTWDNFTPSKDDPASGTVRAGNGNLLSAGSEPAGDPQFAYDARNLLQSYTETSKEATQDYDYSADQMLSRAEFGGDTLSFYYDGGAVRRVVTQKQGKDGRTSGRMGPGRYLSDGTEQVLMAPRKDTSALYHPGSDALTAYAYTPYGDTPAGSPAPDTEYDLAENPFQFAGEYRDPVWGGYYMRARWYDPELPGFISRDPVQNINRYAYGGGNPVMHVDPTGKDFFHSMGWFNHRLNRGTGGGFARFFLAPMMGPLAILSDPKSFWHAIMHNTAGIDVFLALGIVSEGLGGYLDYDAVQDVVAHTRSRRYLYRSVSDAGLGVGQSTAAGAHRGWHHFDWKTFGKGMEMAGGVNVFWRGLMGANVNSGFRSGSHMAQLLDDFHASASDGDTLVFRVKEPLLGSNHSLPNLPVPKDAPLLEALGLGLYHEKLVAVTYQVGAFGDNDTLWVSEVEVNGLERNAQTQTPAAMRTSFNDSTRRFELVGRTSNFRLQDFFENPTGINLDPNDNAGAIGGPFAAGGVNSYNTLWNNCHTHAYYVLKGMGLR